ncbi:MAG TPA: hypothetical protein VEV41_27750 [Terriglobales bacterium]|jgi:hypothetical protein|nr:hypothetical protein [Terriglobales bacterium]
MLEWRGRKLARLHKELETIDVLNRLHEYDPDRGDEDVYVARQTRRSEVLAAIAKLEGKAPLFKRGGQVGGLALLLCATAYTTFHYLLR